MTVFNTKFFCGEAKFILAKLGRTRQFLCKDLDLYVKKFHERALGYCDAVDEETRVDFCLHSITSEYFVYLETLTFSSFSKLMEAARRTYESAKKIPRPSLASCPKSITRLFPRERLIVAAVEKN